MNKSRLMILQCLSIIHYCRFGGDRFSFSRMSWIKTNFLWMMYRSGWARKNNQERVLAVRITREGFDHILSKAFLTGRAGRVPVGERVSGKARLQWDPDHTPTGEPLRRKAIQLGLRNEVRDTQFYGTTVCMF